MSPAHQVTIQFFKYPDTPHWRHEMVHLGEDEHGTWLGAPRGTLLQRGAEPPIIWNRPFVQLIQADRPWIPIWNLEPVKSVIYVDITTVPRRPSSDRFETIDLDLDVEKLIDGTIQVLDEDEFEEHQASLGYPEWMIDQARASTADVVMAIEAERAPFDGSHLPWFTRLTDLRRE